MLPSLAFALLLAPSAPQGAPPTYYDTVDASSPAALRATLHAVIDDHQRFPYTSGGTDTWNILELADEDPGNSGRILDVYRNATYAKAGGGNSNYDREHTWPSSYGFPNEGGSSPYTDCHQLRLCRSSYNSTRGSRPFQDCATGCTELGTLPYLGVGGGSGTYPGQSNWYGPSDGPGGRFEVWTDRRGDVARSLLYLDVRYDGSSHGSTGSSEPDLALTDNPALIAASFGGSGSGTFHMGYLSTLLAWHAADPPDQKERDRNDVVFSFQGNRNPFVDHPEWVACLFEGACNPGPPTLTASSTSIDLSTGGLSLLSIDAAPTLGGSFYVMLGSLSGSAPGLPYFGFTVPLNAPDPWFTLTLQGTPLLTNSIGVLDAQGDAQSLLNLPAGLPATLIGRTATQAAVLLANDGLGTSVGVTNPVDVDLVPGGSGGGALVINELDYDQPGTDTAEFIELFNGSGASVALGGLALELVNGSTGSIYSTLALGAAGTLAPGEYLVLGTPSVLASLPPGTVSLALPGADNNVQNGAPDALRLVDGAGTVLDAVSYEGLVTGFSEGATAGTDTGVGSLSRLPNGQDSDDNGADFGFVTSPSPGASN